MAGGPGRRKAKRDRSSAPARPRRPALGNDPFERGAAEREPAVAAIAIASTTAIPTSGLPERPAISSTAGRAAQAASSRLADVERRIDAALEGIEGRLEDLAARAGLASVEGELREAFARLLPAMRARLGGIASLLRLFEPPERLDPFGMDPRFAERLEPVVEFFYSTWWRTQVRGIEAVPAKGPAVIVANHAGIVPWDAFVLRHALRREHPAHRELRPLLDDRECEVPIFGAAAVRAGAVRASPDAADRILAAGDLLGVFPEGSAGARKSWRDRYTLVRFGRGGFVKVALRARAPIVPCAIVGSEEASPGISRTGWLAERLGVPLLSANPALRLAPAALLPLPSRWSLRFGDPIPVAEHGPAGADDPAVVNALAERVRAAVQSMLDEDVAARSSVFL
ncbi:MAG TPA: lysophospholipid acyltransferase family protein [Anaeromyxobacter sp.]